MKDELLIVGAGISGLYLASLLEDKYNITIVEARQRIGGRVFSIQGHDIGPSWVWSHHKQILSLINSFSLEIFEQYSSGYALYDANTNVESFQAPPQQKSYRLEATLSHLVDKIYNSLKNTKVIFNQHVDSLKDLGEKIEVQTQDSIYTADKVILTLPPRLTSKLDFKPPLPKTDLEVLSKTQTWMGNSAKCVIVCKNASWREKGLSGFVFSHKGPLSEIHDASTKNEAALFGFVSSNANMKSFEEDVKVQIKRLFDLSDEDILKVHIVDWREEIFSSTKEDFYGVSQHPKYGIDIQHFKDKLFFSSTEFSHKEGGYLEGAIIRANEVSKTLINKTTYTQ